MKLYILILWIALSPCLLLAQSNTIERFIQQFAEEDGTNISLQGFSLNLVANFTTDSKSDKVLSKITKLRLLAFREHSPVTDADIRRLLRQIKRDKYEDLMEIRHEGKNVKFMILERGGWITDVVMLSKGKDSFVLISVAGKIHLEELEKLNINIDGGEPFEQV